MRYSRAIVNAGISRLRPVLLMATTVLGVIPPMRDLIWVGMAVTVMAGLAMGSVLTMSVGATLYLMFCRIRSPEKHAA